MNNELTRIEVEQLQRKLAIQTRLAEISAVMSSTLQLEPLLETITDAAAEITDSISASVLLWNSKTRELFFVASTSGSAVQHLLGKPVPLDSIAGTILQENRVVQVDDVKADPRHYGKVDEESKFTTQSLLGVPLRYKDRVIGVLEAVNKRQLPWTEDDQDYLSVLAAQAAVAIEVAQLVMELRKANQELSQVDKLKNDFIAIASHELRTPLGVILGYASFLQEDATGEVGELAAKVMSSALQLRSIIEGMINLRYLKQTQSDLKREKLSVADLLQDVQYDILSLAEGNQLSVTVQPAEAGLMVLADRAKVNMALTNILNNAVNFTPAGGTITIGTAVRNKDEVWISVRDSGIGLEKDQLDQIFEEFYQVEDHMIRKVGGLGIGLCISKAIAEAHGGRIWADSPGLKQGATFTLALPLTT